MSPDSSHSEQPTLKVLPCSAEVAVYDLKWLKSRKIENITNSSRNPPEKI